MRDIIFRGKRKDNGEWVEGRYYKQTHCYGDPSVKHYMIVSTEDLGYDQVFEYYEIIPETVGQFTGLHDKNGKMIFEGDVVRALMNWGRYGMVESVVVIEFKNYEGYRWQYFDVTTIEVINNIYDNPELMEVR